MPWIKIKRTIPTSKDPIISINNNRFSYNVIFYRIAELSRYNYVSYFIDSDNRKIGFEFSEKEEPDSFKIIKNRNKGYYSQSTEMFKLPWIRKVSLEKSICRFKPIKEGKKWLISLIPVFEYSMKRIDFEKISPDAKGIYRYLNRDKIVYIGKGAIKARLKELNRKDWHFDTIEYSLIENQNEQYDWESFWIEKYKRENDGFLPPYNMISGKLDTISKD